MTRRERARGRGRGEQVVLAHPGRGVAVVGGNVGKRAVREGIAIVKLAFGGGGVSDS